MPAGFRRLKVTSCAWPLALALGAIALYASTLDHPFISDDDIIVAGNPTVTQPSLTGLARLWTIDYWQAIDEQGRTVPLADDRNLFRPVTIASLWLNAWLGMHPAAFRMVNALLHAAAAWTVGRLCMSWTDVTGALVASIAVLVHPVATDVVNRVVGRADILVLLGVAGFLTAQRAADRHGWTGPRAARAACWAGMAFGAKESGAVLIPLAIVQAWLGRATRDVATARVGDGHSAAATARAASGPPASTAGRVWPGTVALAAPLVLYIAARAAVVGLPHYRAEATWDLIGNPLWGLRLTDRLAAAAALAWEYARLLIWPWPLLAFNVPATLPTWSDATPWLGIGVVATLVATALRGIGRRVSSTVAPSPRLALAFATSWWLACFLVVAQLITPIGAYFEVRFAYPFLGGVALAVAVAAERVARAGPAARATALAALAAAALLACGLVTIRNQDFRTLETLLRADLRTRPRDAAVLLRLANLLDDDGRASDAEDAYKRVSALAPSSAQAAYELGDFYVRHGRPELGRELLTRAVAINPSHHLALLRLGNMAIDAGDVRAARVWLERAAAAAPDDPFVLYALAVLDDARGDAAHAIARLESLVARRPDFTLAVRGLAQLKQAHPNASSRP